MIFPKTINDWLKIILWLGLMVILFSPLYLNSHLFFPFIVTKTVVFNIAVEIMFLIFLLLSWRSSEYSIRLNLGLILLGVYIFLIFVSSLLGDNFYHSFWSNNERSEGIILLLHLFLFLLILTSFFRKFKDWLYIFDIFFFSSILVSLIALGQYFKLPWLFASGGGQRLAGTIGNAGYMAGFLVFAVFLGLFLIFYRKNIYFKIYYGIGVILSIFVAVNTQTRGGILALMVTSFIFLLYLFFFYFKNNKSIRNIGLAVLLLIVVAYGFLYFNRDSDLVYKNNILSSMTNFSPQSNTAQNRLWTWGSAWQGFKERPVFGWGYENFYQSFDKYFNPNIYRKAGSVIWYDRAHNIIFDRLLTGGILGLLSYLLFLSLPFYYLWRYFLNKEGNKNKYLVPAVFTLIILAYFIQNLFIFEALAIYIPLFLVLAFAGLFSPRFKWQFLASKNFKSFLLVLWLIVLLPVFYFVDIKPLRANIDLTKAISSKSLSVEQRIELFQDILAQNTYGNQEYRRQLFDFFESLIRNKYSDENAILALANFTEKEMDKQLAENPFSASNHLLAMRFNNVMFNWRYDIYYLNKSLDLFEKIKELSPTRQHIYFEAGYSYYYLASYYKQTNQEDMADQYFDLAIKEFEYAMNLNRGNLESYRQLINILISAGKNQKIADLINQTNEEDVSDARAGILNQIVATAISAKNYEVIKIITRRLIELEPDNLQYYAQLSMAHAYLGENEKAIEIARKVIELDSAYKEQSEDFIKKVQNGEFK